MTTSSCVVIDYGIGNVFSVTHALQSLGADVMLTRDPKRIQQSDRVILPGVGAFGQAADRLREYGLDDTIREFIATERPFLGICVGMQLLMSRGHEFGTHEGLNIIPGTVDKIQIQDENERKLRIPLIGWFPLSLPKGQDAEHFSGTLLEEAHPDAAYYFVHSYSACPTDSTTVLATVMHAGQPVTAAVHRENVIGLQFHPERSGVAGLSLLDRFLKV